ncbi:MAG: FtsX-like permease family protein [Woeseiaceae bacterium]|nr:FtsX-like permease family protein [Woeseiaceae bacterium]
MIPVTYRANFSYLLRHPWQLALAIVGVAIGVAVIVAVDLANASARKAFLLSMDAVTGEATHQVIGGPRGVDESVYASLRVDAGIRAIAPVVEGNVRVGERSLDLMGIDLFAEQDLREFTGQVDTAEMDDADAESVFRALLTDPTAVTMSRTTANELGLEAGDAFDVIADGRTRPATLFGTFDSDGTSIDNLLIADIATAQAWLGQQGWLSRLDVRIEDGDDAALKKLEDALPAGTRVLTAAGRTRTTAELSKAFMTNLTAMSLLALLVGLFLIYNSVNFSVLQRRGLIGSLRALGMTRRELFTLIMTEAALIGLISATVGVLLGAWLGDRLLALVSLSINDFYFRVNATNVTVSAFSVTKGMLAGVGAALVASAVPALEAMAYEPRLAMARSTLEQHTSRFLPIAAILGIATMAAAVIVLLASGQSLVAGLTAVFMLILGFALCVPLVVGIVSRAIAPATTRAAGTTFGMSVSGIAASLSRTGIAIVALAVAVSATIGVSVMVDSFRGSVSDWLEQSLQADVYTGVERGDMDPTLIADIVALAGVEHYSTSRRAWLEDDESRVQLIAIQMAPGGYAGTEILDADPDRVWPRWEAGDVVLVSEPYAYQNAVAAGDTITLRTRSGDTPFEIGATYQSYDINASAVMLSRATYDRHYDDDGIDSIGLYLADGVDADAFVETIGVLAGDRQLIRASSNVGIRELSLEIFDRTFVITDVLYWLALGVAFIGILGAMLALQLERTRELATLRALGMTPAQIGGMITGQTATIGLFSGIAAVPLGLIMAWVLIEVINRRAFGWQIDMTVAPGILGSAVVFAVGAAMLAGLYPAMRASRVEPAVAMREE